MMNNLFNVIKAIFFINQTTQSDLEESTKLTIELGKESKTHLIGTKWVDCNYSDNYYGDQCCQIKVK